MGREEGGEDVAEGDPVMHWHLLMQEGMIWQHLGLLDEEQPWLTPSLKEVIPGMKKTYSGDIDISPGLAETKRNQLILEKLDLPIFLGSSRFFLN